MKPILKFPKIIILSLLGCLCSSAILGVGSEGEKVLSQVVEEVPLSLTPYSEWETEYYDPETIAAAAASESDLEEGLWPGGGGLGVAEQHLTSSRSGRAMYLAQGVEFVFPIGVQYTLANLNEQLWPIGTEGFDGVLEFPKNKIAIMFSSMINTLKIANFTVSSKIYTPEPKSPTTPLRILGTDFKLANFQTGYKETWASINGEISAATGGAIPEFIPRGGLYGRTIYPFTTAAYVNSLHYSNQWAAPWRDGPISKFTDSPAVPYMEVEGLMPYYENDAFIAVAALFKSGTGSVVFLKPKGVVTILQLMLNPTALTQIFDENFPGWGVKQMRVRVPQASFTTNSQHFDMLVKRGVSNSFCIHETPSSPGGGESSGDPTRYSLNPIVQTNHIRIAKDTFAIASVTGVTLNNEKDLNTWSSRQRDDMAPETLLEEYTTPKSGDPDGLLDDDDSKSSSSEEDIVSTTLSSLDDEAVVEDATPTPSSITSGEERSDLGVVTSTSTSDPGTESSTDSSSSSSSSPTPSTSTKVEDPAPAVPEAEEGKTSKKGVAPPPAPVVEMDFYDFNEPFLWFLHAINEEPMFMGVVESFKRYLEETGNKENIIPGDKTPPTAASGLIDKNRWIYEAAKGVLWHCPSLINKQAE